MIKTRMKETITNKADFSYFNSTVTFCLRHRKYLAKIFPAMFYLSTYSQSLGSYCRKNFEQDDISASAVLNGVTYSFVCRPHIEETISFENVMSKLIYSYSSNVENK